MLGVVCIDVANPPQCRLVNQPPWGNASQDADGLGGALPWSLTCWVDPISFLPQFPYWLFFGGLFKL